MLGVSSSGRARSRHLSRSHGNPALTQFSRKPGSRKLNRDGPQTQTLPVHLGVHPDSIAASCNLSRYLSLRSPTSRDLNPLCNRVRLHNRRRASGDRALFTCSWAGRWLARWPARCLCRRPHALWPSASYGIPSRLLLVPFRARGRVRPGSHRLDLLPPCPLHLTVRNRAVRRDPPFHRDSLAPGDARVQAVLIGLRFGRSWKWRGPVSPSQASGDARGPGVPPFRAPASVAHRNTSPFCLRLARRRPV